MQLFDFLPSLPEEEVGTSCRAKHGDHRHRMGTVKHEMRNEGAREGRSPRYVRCEHDGHIRKQRQRRPFEHRGVACVADKCFEQDTSDAEEDGIKVLGATGQQAQRRAHGAEVRAEINDIGDDEQKYDGAQKPHRVVASQVLRDAVTRDATDPGADRLDHGHQRKAKQHGPGEAVAELGAHLTVSGDSAWIIVCRPGHQTWTQAFQKPHRPQRGFSWTKLCVAWARLRRCSHRHLSRRSGLPATRAVLGPILSEVCFSPSKAHASQV
jgi:hypothetical protein